MAMAFYIQNKVLKQTQLVYCFLSSVFWSMQVAFYFPKKHILQTMLS